MKRLLLLVVIAALCALGRGEEPYAQLAHHFDYDAKAPLELQEAGVENRGGVTIHDVSYASPKGGRVPAYLVVPAGKGPFAAILFGHWAKDDSPVCNRKEFLEEAIVLAHAGAISLLIDAPFARPGFQRDPDPLAAQSPLTEQQQVIDLRRGVDLLLSRSDVDAARLAYVGHSFDAAVGTILAGVEKRIHAFVLMAGTFSVARLVHSDDPRMVAFRKQIPAEKIDGYLATWDWLDPTHYVGHIAPSAVFLQYARTDAFVGDGQRESDIPLFSEPKTVKIYEHTDHALNAEARRDRYEWLRQETGLRALDPVELERVPLIK